jgi:transposase
MLDMLYYGEEGRPYMDYIKGTDRHQQTLLPRSLDEYISTDNPVRAIDALVDSLDLPQLGFARCAPNRTGRPMYDPKDMLKLYVYGYMNSIRSSRGLEREASRNLEVMWLIGGLKPDFKTIADFRKDNAGALKGVFSSFVRTCLEMGLYGREAVAIDGSKFEAVNSNTRNYTEKSLKDALARVQAGIDDWLDGMDGADVAEEGRDDRLEALLGHRADLEALRERMEEEGLAQISLTDPDSKRMRDRGRSDVCYNVQCAVDDRHHLMVGFAVTDSCVDKNLLLPMAASAAEALQTDTLVVMADAGYDSATDIASCIRNGIRPHVAGCDMEICLPAEVGRGQEIISHEGGRAVYIPERNIALCPMGHALLPRGHNKRSHTARFTNPAACRQCGCRCRDSAGSRAFVMDMAREDFSLEYDTDGLEVRKVRVSPDPVLIKRRGETVEHPFGTVKRALHGGYCLTRGIKKVTGEFALLFLAYNLRRVINLLGVDALADALMPAAQRHIDPCGGADRCCGAPLRVIRALSAAIGALMVAHGRRICPSPPAT